jgi:hypothetical protein
MIPGWLLRGVRFCLFELREVEGDGGGDEVAVSGEDPGGESVGGGGISSAGVIGDCVCGSLRLKSSKCSTSELASLRLAYVHCRHESLSWERCSAKSP